MRPKYTENEKEIRRTERNERYIDSYDIGKEEEEVNDKDSIKKRYSSTLLREKGIIRRREDY